MQQRKIFADWLLEQMSLHGMSQADVCRAGGIKSSAVSNILSLKMSVGDVNARRFAKAFGVPEEEVMKKAGIMTNSKDRIKRHTSKIITLLSPLSDQDADSAVDLMEAHIINLRRKRGKST